MSSPRKVTARDDSSSFLDLSDKDRQDIERSRVSPRSPASLSPRSPRDNSPDDQLSPSRQAGHTSSRSTSARRITRTKVTPEEKSAGGGKKLSPPQAAPLRLKRAVASERRHGTTGSAMPPSVMTSSSSSRSPGADWKSAVSPRRDTFFSDGKRTTPSRENDMVADEDDDDNDELPPLPSMSGLVSGADFEDDDDDELLKRSLPATPRDQASPRAAAVATKTLPFASSLSSSSSLSVVEGAADPPPLPPLPSYARTELSGLSIQFNKEGKTAAVKLEYAGWLLKKGKRRYFVLRGDTLFWFSKKRALDGDLAKGANNLLPLLGCTAEPCSGSIAAVAQADAASASSATAGQFIICPPDGKSYTLQASSASEMKTWLTVISAAARAQDRLGEEFSLPSSSSPRSADSATSPRSTSPSTSPRSATSAPVAHSSICQGYLTKRGKKRYFVIEGGQLKWYLSARRRRDELRGCIPLHDCRMRVDLNASLLTLESTGEAKSYLLTAASSGECDRWRGALDSAIDRAVTASRQRVSAARRKSLRSSLRLADFASPAAQRKQSGLRESLGLATEAEGTSSAAAAAPTTPAAASDENPQRWLRFDVPYTIPVSGNNSKPFTAYMVEVTDTRDGSSRSLLKRYRQFEGLQSTFQKLYERSALPPFPPKRLVGNMSASFVASRRLHLERWLRAVVKLPGALEVPELVYFLTEEQIEDGWRVSQPPFTASETELQWKWIMECETRKTEQATSRLVLFADEKSHLRFKLERGRDGTPPWINQTAGEGVASASGPAPLSPRLLSPRSLSSTSLERPSATSSAAPGDQSTSTDDESNFIIEDMVEKDFAYYGNYFAELSHDNFVSDDSGGSAGGEDDGGPFVVSITSEPVTVGLDTGAKTFKAIVRSKRGDERVSLSLSGRAGRPERLRALQQVSQTRGIADARLVRVAPALLAKISHVLTNFEQKMVVSKYKIGVLFVKEGQTEENVMYANNSIHSEAFDRFLCSLGEKIELKGWDKYTGGLDARHGSTGTSSIYTKYKHFQVMFHVAPWLPYQPDDTQHVERKRHLGNDVVLIIFLENEATTFDPSVLTSHFNHAFVCVRPEKKTGGLYSYRVEVACKPGFRPTRPFLPSRCLLNEGKEMRAFLLTKLINLERVAMSAPEFVGLSMRTRNLLLNDIIQQFRDHH